MIWLTCGIFQGWSHSIVVSRVLVMRDECGWRQGFGWNWLMEMRNIYTFHSVDMLQITILPMINTVLPANVKNTIKRTIENFIKLVADRLKMWKDPKVALLIKDRVGHTRRKAILSHQERLLQDTHKQNGNPTYNNKGSEFCQKSKRAHSWSEPLKGTWFC